jgi:16S rRNA (cytosine1402-N4)-methyltransferase
LCVRIVVSLLKINYPKKGFVREMCKIIHTPVLVEEVVSFLMPRGAGETMSDATIGEGGHTEAFLTRFPDLHIIGIDADKSILERAKKRLEGFGGRITFYSGWSHDFFASCKERFDTILIDLGISMYHYAVSGRGFSFVKDEPLDMRLDASTGESAADIVASLSEEELADLLYNNADERYSRRIAHGIVEARSRGAPTSSRALADIVLHAYPRQGRHGSIHPATKTFQALRIAVNNEISRLPGLLEAAVHCLKDRGRLGVISFHAGETRIVRRYFQELHRGGSAVLLTKKAVSPSFDEVKCNPSSRSAVLRVIEKGILRSDNERKYEFGAGDSLRST